MKTSISKSVLVGCLLLVVLLSLILGFQTYSSFSDVIYHEYEERLRNIVTHVSHMTDADDLRVCIETGVSSPRRDEMQIQLNRMVDEFGLAYLYIIVPEKDGQSAMISVISSTSAAERAAGIHEDVALLYDGTEFYTEAEIEPYREAWRHPGEISVFQGDSDYGLCYTGCRPLLASDGEVVALVCADFAVDAVLAAVQRYSINDIVTSAVLCILFTLLLLLWLWKNVTHPIRQVEEAVVDFAKRNHGRSDLDELHMNIPDLGVRNEVSTLADTVVEMAEDMRDYVINILVVKHEADEMKDQVSAAEAASKAKSRFLAQMSHEIRTPINAVLGMNEMILNEAKDEHILDYSSNIDYAGRQLLSIINTILDFSKIEDGKMEIVPANYDLASVINNLVNGAMVRAKMKSLSFTVEVDQSLPSGLFGDDVRVTQVIQNILTNAVKYTEEGGVTFTVKNGGREGDDVFLDVAVKDTGIGIRKEDMEKLFESFERLEMDRNRRIEGTGLGMSIVTNLLKMMGSKLKVESIYGVGSTFSFTLRQRVVDERPIGNFSERVASLARQKGRDLVMHAPEAKVLVVDDNAMNLKVAKNLLKMSGILPDLARSGTESIDMIRDNFYDIVFMDHMMPGMDGIQTLMYLREEDMVWPGMQIIALTANAVSGAREEYLEAGFTDYLSKPINSRELEEKLARYLPPEKVTWRRKSQTGAAEKTEKTEKAEKAENADGPARKAAEAEAPARESAKRAEAAVPAHSEEVLEFAPGSAEEILEFGPDGGETAGGEEVLEFGPSDGALEFGPGGSDAGGAAAGGGDAISRAAAAGIHTDTGLQYCAGDRDFYLELMGDFVADHPDKTAELELFYNDGNWADYRVVIHALKSTAKTIGAPELFEQAKSLEDAAARTDETYLKEHHALCMELYRDISNTIQNALGGASAQEE